MKPKAVESMLDAPTERDIAALQRHWRATHSDEVAEVLERVGQTYLAQHPRPSIRGREAFQRAWLELAKAGAPEDCTWLALTLSKQLPASERFEASNIETTHRGLRERLEALAALGPDPRLSAAVAKALLESPFAMFNRAELLEVYEAGFSVLTADHRQAAVLKRGLDEPVARAGITRALLAEAVPKLMAVCAAVKSKLTAEERKAWATLGASGQSVTVTPHQAEPALLAQVLENERSDSPRFVYADALTERAEPRGEFISLQLSRELSPTAHKRERALLKANQATWLGPLHSAFTHHVFHRGFLYEAQLAHNAKVDARIWQQALSHPELAFVRRLGLGRGSSAQYVSFLSSPLMQRVTDVDVTTAALLKYVLDQTSRPFEGLTFKNAPTLAELVRLTGLPRLKRLSIDWARDDPAFVTNLARSGVLEKVSHLVVRVVNRGAELLQLIGTGALTRVTFAGLADCFTVTKEKAGFVIEGEAEYDSALKEVLLMARHAARVNVAVTRLPSSEERLAWLDAWLEKNADQHTFLKLKKARGGAFHERLRLMLSTDA